MVVHSLLSGVSGQTAEPKDTGMRTVSVDVDHVARYERVSKHHFRFVLVHAATGRELTE